MGVECPPETVIHLAADESLIKLLLGAPLQGLPAFERRMPLTGKRREYLRAIRKQKCVAHIEEDVTAFGHDPYYCGISEVRLPTSDLGLPTFSTERSCWMGPCDALCPLW